MNNNILTRMNNNILTSNTPFLQLYIAHSRLWNVVMIDDYVTM